MGGLGHVLEVDRAMLGGFGQFLGGCAEENRDNQQKHEQVQKSTFSTLIKITVVNFVHVF